MLFGSKYPLKSAKTLFFFLDISGHLVNEFYTLGYRGLLFRPDTENSTTVVIWGQQNHSWHPSVISGDDGRLPGGDVFGGLQQKHGFKIRHFES